MVKNLRAMPETWVRSLGWEDPLEEGMATHSSVLAWRIPGTEESVGCRLWGRTESDMTESTYQQQQQQATKHSTVHNVCICLIMERVAISLSNA